MVGNKNSGRRPHDGLPHGGGRPRTRLIVNIPTHVIVQLAEIAEAEGGDELDVVREAILSYISDWQDQHDD
jgi:hypothetical protein